MRAHNTSIQKKLMQLIMLICGAVLFVACASFFVYELITYRKIARDELETLGKVTATNSTSSLAFNVKEDAQEVLKALSVQKHIAAAVLYDKDGQLFAAYPEKIDSANLPAKHNGSGFDFRNSYIEGYQPVILGNKRIGTLFLKSDMKAVYKRFSFYGLIALLFFLFAFLLTYLLSRRLHRSVSEPILQLAEKARLISERKDYSVRADKKSNDEIGILTDAFNHMLTQIQAQNIEIHALNNNLEEKIAVRTWELQEANKALTEQNEFIQTIIDASIDLIAVFDRDLNYLILNQYAARVFQRNREDVIGKNILQVFPQMKDKPLIQHLHNALNGKFVHVAAYQSQLADAWFENFLIPLKDQDDNIDRVLLIGHDITETMRANEKLRQLNSELEKSNRDLEQFAYVASHDLQEPLRKIMTFSDLSERNIHNPEIQKRYLQKISSSAGRMTELIRAVLNYSRLSRTGVELTDVDLNLIIEQLQTDLELLIQEKGARIVSEKLPLIKGIPLQLSQLFLNLFTNALKFSERPPVITIRVVPVTPEESQEAGLPKQDSDFLKIVFTDNGIGFEQQYANRLFSIFQRLHSSDSYAGTGIGLALCKKIVENHGGAITVESEPGKGTTFFLYFPYDKNGNEDLHQRLRETVGATGKTITS